MAVYLIFLSFLITILLLKISNDKDKSWRDAFMEASVIHGLIIVVITEVLSIVKKLNFNSLVFFWSLVNLLNIAILIKLLYLKKKLNLKQNIITLWKNKDTTQLVPITGTIIILSICLFTALVVPPFNYDSMTYHLPRVMHWVQNQSVAHYPTHNLRQISLPPGVSYIVTHLQILSGSDRFANCVQWIAFLGSVIGTSLIAKSILGIQAQSITALVCACIPMAIRQSTTPQTDLVVSFWLVCFTYFIHKNHKYSYSDIFFLAVSWGLAILAKPTGIIFGIPLFIILSYRVVKSSLQVEPYLKDIYTSLKILSVIFIITLSLSLPSYWRNYQTFGSVLGVDTQTTNTIIGLKPLISNLLRNLALNMPLLGFWELIEKIHQQFLNININEPALTFADNTFDFNYLWWRLIHPEDENFIGSPVHLLLGLIAIVTLIISILRDKKILFELLFLTISNISGFLLFCLLLKWQVWGNRLSLPVFVLSSPVITYFLNYKLLPSLKRILILIIIFIAIIYSINPLQTLLNGAPIILNSVYETNSNLANSRQEFYFRGAGPALKTPYIQLTKQARKEGCNTVGLDIGGNDWEYPIWYLMKSQTSTVKIKHVNVQNQSSKLEPEFSDTKLCAIFDIKGLSTKYIKLK